MKDEKLVEKTPESEPVAEHHEESAVKSVTEHPVKNRKKEFAGKVYELLLYVYGAITVLLLSRFLFSLVGARQAAPYVEFVYELSTPLMIPFSNMFGLVQTGPYRIEFEILVALVVYGVIFYGTAQLIRILFD